MATATGITLSKTGPYRGGQEEFSNKYWFKGQPPGDAASWQVLASDLINSEKAIFPSSVSYTHVYGYDNTDPAANHVFSWDLTAEPTPPTGTFFPTPTAGHFMSGDQASTVGWHTDALSAKGKEIYLRKYFHHGFIDVTQVDDLEGAYFVALDTFAGPVANFHGGLRSQARDLNAGSHVIQLFVTTRTLKHRGKRGGPA